MHKLSLAAVALATLAARNGAIAHQAGIDGGLYAIYEAGDTIVRFSVCGELPQSSGCYGGGQIAPLERACAVVEGKRRQKNNIVLRDVYVLDRRDSASDPVLLYVYRRIDTITQGKFDDVEFKFVKKVALPIQGGAASHCSLAANDTRVFAGTDATDFAASMDKRDYTTRTDCGFAFDAPVLAITADSRGYVTIRQQGGFCVLNDNSDMKADGGGFEDMVGQRGGWVFN